MVGEGWRNQVEEGTWAWRSGYGGEGLLGGYGNGKSGLGSFRMGSSQAVLVFQITDGSARPFQLTVDKLEQALLEATLKVRRAPCVLMGAAAPDRS